MATNCASLIAYLFLLCYERDFMNSYNKEAEIIQAFNLITRYPDDVMNNDNPYFEGMMGRIYPPVLQITKLMRLIPNPHFWIYIYLFQTDLFQLNFMISEMTFDFNVVKFPFFWTGTFPILPLTGFTFLTYSIC